jgi:hypothetical protein
VLGPGDKVDPGGSTACALVDLVVDEVGIGDNLQLVCGLEVKAVKSLLHDRLDLHEVVNVRVGEHRVHLLG